MSIFTTGQVKYRTHIPPGTIQRYIKTFAEHFSEAARVPDKSRRYTEDDVQKINIIRKMYQTHAAEHEISAALAGVIESHALPVGDFENVLQLAEAARLAQIEAEKSAQRANESQLGISDRLKYYDNQYFEFKKRIKILEEENERQKKNMQRVLSALDHEGLLDNETQQSAQLPRAEKKKSIIKELAESLRNF